MKPKKKIVTATVRPLRDVVVCRRTKRDQTEGGLFIPGSADMADILTVVAAGPDAPGLEPGERVVLLPRATACGIPEDDDIFMIPYDGIAGVISTTEKADLSL